MTRIDRLATSWVFISSSTAEFRTRRTCCGSRQMYGASRIENCGTNWPNCAAPSSTIWIAPEEADSMMSRDEPSCPAGKVWISTDPPVSSRTCLATRSIIATPGWLVASTVAQRSVVAAPARRGNAPTAMLASPAPIHLRRVQRIELPIAPPPLVSIRLSLRTIPESGPGPHGRAGAFRRDRAWAACLFGPGLGLPQPQRGAGRVDDDRQPAHAHDFGDVLHYGGAQGFCLFGRRFDVVDQHIGEPERLAAGHRIFHHPAAGAVADADHRVITACGGIRDVFQLPVEQLAVKALRLGDIVGFELDMHERIAHCCSPVSERSM